MIFDPLFVGVKEAVECAFILGTTQGQHRI